jgi:hypothetical protein
MSCTSRGVWPNRTGRSGERAEEAGDERGVDPPVAQAELDEGVEDAPVAAGGADAGVDDGG